MTSAPRYILLDKPLGQTPLQAIKAWKHEHPFYKDIPASYAGRLDPMATGTLLVLLGDECRQQERYRGLDKEYEIEVLFDISTDTGDVLGMPVYVLGVQPGDARIQDALRSMVGSADVPYPAYSSKTVDGKPLFLHALEGTLGSIDIPLHTETIYRIRHLKTEIIPKAVLRARIKDVLTLAPRSTEPSKALGADFRQDVIKGAWESLFESFPERDFQVLSLRVSCASGTYMRTLAERIGTELRVGALALSIRRTRIGRYQRFLSGGFWRRTF